VLDEFPGAWPWLDDGWARGWSGLAQRDSIALVLQRGGEFGESHLVSWTSVLLPPGLEPGRGAPGGRVRDATERPHLGPRGVRLTVERLGHGEER